MKRHFWIALLSTLTLGAVPRAALAETVTLQWWDYLKDVAGDVTDVEEDHAPVITTAVDPSAPRSTSASAHTAPPCRWIIRWTIARPTPVPGNSSARCSR